MRVSNQNGCIWITHSRYYSQWTGGLPYAPFTYWNVITDDDIIPVCTHGYKTLKSAQRQISSYISNVKECKVLHVETEEEHEVQFLKCVSKYIKTSNL